MPREKRVISKTANVSAPKAVAPKKAAGRSKRAMAAHTAKPSVAPPAAEIVVPVEKEQPPIAPMSIGAIAYVSAVGRRKRAIANVRLSPGKGEIIVNGKPLSAYFPFFVWQNQAIEPLVSVNRKDEFSISIKVHGGGIQGQVDAVRLGIARALLKFNAELKSALRSGGYLTRDARVRERKKYGFKSARRAPQWAKR